MNDTESCDLCNTGALLLLFNTELHLYRANCKQVMLWISVDGEDMLASDYLYESLTSIMCHCYFQVVFAESCDYNNFIITCLMKILKLDFSGHEGVMDTFRNHLASVTSFPNYQVSKLNHYLWNLLFISDHLS